MVILQEAPDGSILQLTYDTASKQLCTENEMVFVQLPMNEPILGEFPEEADIDNSSNVESSHFSTTNPSAESTEERFRVRFSSNF